MTYLLDTPLEEIDITSLPLEEDINNSLFVYIFETPVINIPEEGVSAIVRPLYLLQDMDQYYNNTSTMTEYMRNKTYLETQIDTYNKKLGLSGYKKMKRYSDDATTKRDQVRRDDIIESIKGLEIPAGLKQMKKRKKYNIRCFLQMPRDQASIHIYKPYLAMNYTNNGHSFNVYIEGSSKNVIITTTEPIPSLKIIHPLIRTLWGSKKALRPQK